MISGLIFGGIALTSGLYIYYHYFYDVKIDDTPYSFDDDKGLAIQLTPKLYQNGSKNFIMGKDNQTPYEKKHDEAIIFYYGGPVLSDEWKKLKMGANSLFNIDGKIAPTHQADIYLGIEPQWKGIMFDIIFRKALKASGVKDFKTIYIKKPLRKKDKDFLKKFTFDNFNIGNKILAKQTDMISALVKTLKQKGYKKIHLIGHSWGSIILNNYIYELGNDAFKYVDSISCIAIRLHVPIGFKDKLKNKEIPFVVFNNETDSYNRVVGLKIKENAISLAATIGVFWSIANQKWNMWKDLSKENRKKYFAFGTKYDHRVGAFNEAEKNLIKLGFNIFDIAPEKIIKYRENYRKKNPKKFNYKHVTHIKGNVASLHSSILYYVLDNYQDLWLKTKTKNSKTHKNSLWPKINIK